MNEAPVKIWVWEKEAPAFVSDKPDHDDIPYIRGDIVDEMKEVLEQCLKVNGYQNAREKIEVVLEKLKTA